MGPRTISKAEDGIKRGPQRQVPLQPPKTLRSLIQASPVIGSLQTATNLSYKFHPIRVEKAHISGNFYQETPVGIALFSQAHRIWMSQEGQSFHFSA
ncbi:hypothetical protein CY35_03G123800 [Sphagnum magellanicum]|nr:hypothetical protein CY35_03G123800 [Sphagnum magellanicum]